MTSKVWFVGLAVFVFEMVDPIGIEPTAFALRSRMDESTDQPEITDKQTGTKRQTPLQLSADQRAKLQLIVRALRLLGDTSATSSSSTGAPSDSTEEEAMRPSRDKPKK